MKINPYLNFPGNAEDAFNFYKSVFGGEFAMLQRFKDTPESDKLPPGVENMIMHVALPIGNGDMLMATDAPEAMGFSVNTGNNFYISISPDSREETKRLFDGLSSDGKIEMDLQDMFWGGYYGSFTDKFGVKWMLNYQKQQ
jgi:PhnB protein